MIERTDKPFICRAHGPGQLATDISCGPQFRRSARKSDHTACWKETNQQEG